MLNKVNQLCKKCNILEREYITIENGIDTSDATSTASDIAYNKTAYVNGEKITGIMNFKNWAWRQASRAYAPETITINDLKYSLKQPNFFIFFNVMQTISDKEIISIDNVVSNTITITFYYNGEFKKVEINRYSCNNIEYIDTGIKINPFTYTDETSGETVTLTFPREYRMYYGNSNLGISVDDLTHVIINGEEYQGDKLTINRNTSYICEDVSTIPFNFKNKQGAITYNDEINILGGNKEKKAHYKYNGTEWVNVSTLPYDFNKGGLTLLNNEIHIIGSSEDVNANKHYKYDGVEWVEVSTLPYFYGYTNSITYNNEIHIIGSGFTGHENKHYKYNGTEWVNVSTLPFNFNGFSIVYNNEIHILGGNYETNTKLYKYNGTEWIEVSTLPSSLTYTNPLVFHNEIHIIADNKKHYKYDGVEWKELQTINYDILYSSLVNYNNKIHSLGGNTFTKHCVLTNTTYDVIED